MYLLPSDRSMKKVLLLLTGLGWFLISSFSRAGNAGDKPGNFSQPGTSRGAFNKPPDTFAGKQIPVLCYHQVREWNSSDSKSARTYIVPPGRFAAHLAMLQDSGYHSIGPDELSGYLLGKNTLPSRPVLLTFDDGTASQYTNALPELNKHGFKALFFIMTVTLGRPGYLSREQVKGLSEQGQFIGCHSWDHHNVKQYTTTDWALQLDKPTKVLEKVTGSRIKYFAYPYGAWNDEAIRHLKGKGYVSAFQLSGKQHPGEPLYTIRRIIADGHWSPGALNSAIKGSFK